MCYSRTYKSWYLGLVLFLIFCFIISFILDCILTSATFANYLKKRAMVHPISDIDTKESEENTNLNQKET